MIYFLVSPSPLVLCRGVISPSDTKSPQGLANSSSPTKAGGETDHMEGALCQTGREGHIKQELFCKLRRGG